MTFPHIYGLINTDSVIDVIDFRKNQYGDFFISDELLNFSHYEKSCGAVIFREFISEYKVLLTNFIYNNESRWGFPKGHVENNETEIQTTLREVKEEVGIDIDIISKLRVSTLFSMKKGTINEAVYYCAEAKSLEITCQKGEVERTDWFNFEEAYSHLTYDCDKKILMKFIEFFREFHENH